MADLNFVMRLVQILGKYKLRRSVEYSFKCPKCHDHKWRMDVNFKRGLFHCYNCHWAGYIGELKKYLGLRSPVSRNLESSVAGDAPTEAKEIELPKESQEIGIFSLPRGLHKFLLQRVHDQVIWENWKMCLSGYYADRLIIPVYENSKLVCWIARTWGHQEPKELCPPSSIANRSHFLYNIDGIQPGDNVIVVEGIFDCEHLKRLGYKSVASFGSHLSDIQIGKLLSKNPFKIILMYDGDDAGREGTVKAINALRKRFDILRIRRVDLAEGQDPDDLTLENLKEMKFL